MYGIDRLLAVSGGVVGLILASPAAHAGLTLTNDHPVLQVSPGQTIDIDATLSVTPGSGPFVTNANGDVTANGVFVQHFDVFRPLIFGINSIAEFGQFNSGPNPLANLDIPDGGSVDLKLATLTLPIWTPLGVYSGDRSVDIGISNFDPVTVIDTPPGTICVCTQSFNPPTAPSIDPGPVTFDVTNVPEPASGAILVTGFLVLIAGRRAWRTGRTAALPQAI